MSVCVSYELAHTRLFPLTLSEGYEWGEPMSNLLFPVQPSKSSIATKPNLMSSQYGIPLGTHNVAFGGVRRQSEPAVHYDISSTCLRLRTVMSQSQSSQTSCLAESDTSHTLSYPRTRESMICRMCQTWSSASTSTGMRHDRTSCQQSLKAADVNTPNRKERQNNRK